MKDTLKNKKKKNATEKELDNQKIQDGVGKEGKENTETANENNSENEGGDDDGTDGEAMQKERADLEERDENAEQVEAEVRGEMDGKKSTNGKRDEGDDEIETLSDVKNGEMEGEEVKKSGEETYHLHNGFDEQETSTNEVQEENSIPVVDIDSANQE